jgi:hypothetical protein
MLGILKMLARKPAMEHKEYREPVSLTFFHPEVRDSYVRMQGCVFTDDIAERSAPERDFAGWGQTYSFSSHVEVEFELDFYQDGRIRFRLAHYEDATSTLEFVACCLRGETPPQLDLEARAEALLDQPELIRLGRKKLLAMYESETDLPDHIAKILTAADKVETIILKPRVDYVLKAIYDPSDPRTHGHNGPIQVDIDGNPVRSNVVSVNF